MLLLVYLPAWGLWATEVREEEATELENVWASCCFTLENGADGPLNRGLERQTIFWSRHKSGKERDKFSRSILLLRKQSPQTPCSLPRHIHQGSFPSFPHKIKKRIRTEAAG